jgi:ribonuclease HI
MKAQYFSRKACYSFQAEIYAILACVYKTQLYGRPHKYVSICSDSQVAQKALQAARTSPLVQCQKALKVISTQHFVELSWVPGHAEVQGNETANNNARDGSVEKFVGPQPSLGVAKESIRRKVRRWLDNQHWARRQGLGTTQKQARELILGASLSAETSLLSFHRTQSRVMIGLLTGHNTLRRHLHLMGPTNSPLCRRCGVEDKTLTHILCECEALTSLRHVYMGSFSLDPEDIMSLSLGAIWNFSKGTGIP